MSNELLIKLLDKVGCSKVPLYAREACGYRATVVNSGEFRRIHALPRVDWLEFVEQYSDALQELLRTSRGGQDLWPIQTAALVSASKYGGAFLPIGVGQGKSLISLLAPVVMDVERPILLVPAALRDQTKKHVLPQAEKHWLLHPNLKIYGYSELSLAKNKTLLDDLKPDLIILDECHYLKRKQAGRTKRMVRYFRDNPTTKCVAMSGTISNRSIKDWAHIAEWCLGPNSPVPIRWQELCEWADALDEGVNEKAAVHPGVLMRFCEDGENARQGFRRRLVETPGVVASEEDSLGVSLRLIGRDDIKTPKKIKDSIHSLKNTWETPNGDILSEAVALWRHVRELALGFWYRWDPPAPEDWLSARRAWKSYVNETLKHNRRGLDTELQVWNECKFERPIPEWKEWRDIRHTFKINTVAEWEDTFMLDWLCNWMDKTKESSIVWVEHRLFGRKLSDMSGRKYFGAGDSSILDCKDKVIIASISAHGTGKNLQNYCRNLITCPPTSGKTWEQLLGRTHRAGQKNDEVTCEVLCHVLDFREAVERAYGDARYLEDTYGNQQKLNYCDRIGI